jgi:FHA domain-containing protein
MAPARLPDDFDPFAEPEPAPAPSRPAGMAGASADLLASVGAGTGSSAGIDEAFGLQAMPRAGDADPLAAFIAGAPPGAPPVDAAPSRDPLAMFASPAQAAAEPPRAAAFNHTAELQGAYAPPRVVDTAPSPRAAAAPGEDIFAGLGLDAQPAADPFADLMAPVAPAAVAGTDRASTGRQDKHAADDGRALWSAFCEGAGVRADLPDGPVVPQMRLLGQVMREAVDGTLRLMAVRATAKQELRAAVTTIRSRNNNPLKFAPDLQLALEQLTQPPLRGFMSAPAAMQDAMHDLVGHSIGTMAGMRAALAGVLGRFEPDRLEAKLADKTMLDSLLPMNRKAKLWDLYLQHFGAIRDEAQDDFHTLFGKAFVAAYEEQLDRLPQRSEAA